MGWKTCPACKGTKESKTGASHCLGCGGTGQIEEDDAAVRDRFAANWHDDLSDDSGRDGKRT